MFVWGCNVHGDVRWKLTACRRQQIRPSVKYPLLQSLSSTIMQESISGSRTRCCSCCSVYSWLLVQRPCTRNLVMILLVYSACSCSKRSEFFFCIAPHFTRIVRPRECSRARVQKEYGARVRPETNFIHRAQVVVRYYLS